jgi:hypothetical protein
MTRPRLALALVALGSLAGCGDQLAMDLSKPGAGAGAECDPAKYPCGPFGTTIGQVVQNLQLLGQHDDNGDGKVTDEAVRKIALADYFQNKGIKVLAVLVAAEWCGPCNEEQPELITSWKKYQDQKAGVQYFEAIIEDIHYSPADMTTVDRWAGKNWGGMGVIPFDMGADPTVALGPYYDIAAFPMQMVIQTKDMTIQWKGNGYAPPSAGIPNPLLTNIDSVLQNQ